MKKLLILLTAALISMVASFTSFAGEWKQDKAGWWYDNGDSTFAKDGWNWIDGKCYYFTSEGYCLINTTTPDGYTVDENGAWIIDGVVQTQETSVQTFTFGDLSIKLPEDFFVSEISDTDIVINSLKYMIVIIFNQEEHEYIPVDFDESVIPTFQSCTSKSTVQIGNTTWNRYYFAPSQEPSHIIYFRRNGNVIYMCIVVVGDDGEPIDPDALMNEVIMN